MTQLFNELVEFLEAVEKGESPPPMGPAHQRLVELDVSERGGDGVLDVGGRESKPSSVKACG